MAKELDVKEEALVKELKKDTLFKDFIRSQKEYEEYKRLKKKFEKM